MKSVMKHQFSRIPSANIPRSSFNRSHGHKTCFNMGDLVPIFIDEALPGDTFNLKASLFGRLSTPIFPIMDNMHMDTFFFSVPIRLIWDNWQKFNGEQKNPNDTTDYLVPTITCGAGQFVEGSLEDYFGLPIGVSNIEVCSFWHRAYNLIYNEWFRDENLQDSIPVPTGDGPDNTADFVIRKRNKRHDYFTSALPWPQKGPGVELPLGTSAPVKTTTTDLTGTQTALRMRNTVGGGIPSANAPLGISGSSAELYYGSSGAPTYQASLYPSNLIADLSSATAATINSLRQAFQIQKLLERDARGGTRYTEILRSHFGVISDDARLQRPEFLGSNSTPINISAVAQTSGTGTAAETPQGNLSAFGTVGQNFHGFTKSFTEHCVIIGLVNVRADLTYQTGIRRMFSRQTRFDFYWPALANLGEQTVLNKEIFAQGTSADDDVFGYQERWAEYRYFPSIITNRMRSNSALSLDAWHLSQDFAALPALNSTFIQENPPIKRCLAVQTEPDFVFDSYFSLKCARPMPVYSVPGLIDHF